MLLRKLLKHWRIWIGIIISILFLFLVFRQLTDLGQVIDTAKNANYLYVFPALIVYFIGVWIRAIRWHFILKPIKSISSARLFPVVVIGYMANDVLPARIGEIVRSYILGDREKISKTASLATILVERLFDGLIMLLFMAIVSFFVNFSEQLQQIFKFAGIFLVIFFVIIVVIASSKKLTLDLIQLILKLLPQKFRAPIVKRGNLFIDGLAAVQNFRTVFVGLALSLVAWLFEACMYYILAIGFDLNLPIYAFILTTAVVNLGTMVPSSPGYIGTFEALSVFTLSLFAINENVAFTYTVVLHVLLIVPITFWGFFYLWKYNLSLKKVTSLTETKGEI